MKNANKNKSENTAIERSIAVFLLLLWSLSFMKSYQGDIIHSKTEVKTMMKTEKKTMTVENWVRIWQDENRNFVKESTFATYSVTIENHILPYYGKRELKDISHEDNQEFILFLSKKKRKDGSGYLSSKAVKDIMTLWLGILGKAERKGYVTLGKVRYQYPAPHTQQNMRKENFLTLQEEFEIINCLKNQKSLKSLGVALALVTGMRIGEICALRWECIDIQRGLIHVNKTLQRIYTKENGIGKSKVIVSAPKSLKSDRYIPLPQEYLSIIKEHQAAPLAYLLTGKVDKFIEPRTLRAYYDRLMENNGTRYVTFHGLRHTFATRLVESGCDYKTISELLGHADISTTFRTYVHSDMDKKRQFVEKVRKMIETT